MGKLTVLLGGQKSGKSGLAARRAHSSGRPVVVVTPSGVRDAEFEARVARHRADRPDHWRTVETFDLTGALRDAEHGAFVIVDALDTWLVGELESAGLFAGNEAPDRGSLDDAEQRFSVALRSFADEVRVGERDVVVIAGQPGLGAHAPGAGARAYVDVHGLCLQQLSASADEVLLVVAGRTVPLEPASVPRTIDTPDRDLRAHGDTQVPEGAIDLAVNVSSGPPEWLVGRLTDAVRDLAAYPDDRSARTAAAARHGRPPEECLVVDGAAEAFWLIAQVVRPRLAACVHPSFTEPEAALRTNGVPIVRVQRSDDDAWALDPSAVPDEADLVVLGRPDNPTGVVDPVGTVEKLTRPGRTLLVDEAFADFFDDADGFAGRRDLPGLVSVRSMTKIWGLAGLRVGYVLGPATLIDNLGAARQPWSCNTLALTALEALAGAESERRSRADEVSRLRHEYVAELRTVKGLRVWDSAANFVLVRGAEPDLRDRLLGHGLAARRAETFPGLDSRAVRLAVRDRATNQRVVRALRTIVEGAAA